MFMKSSFAIEAQEFYFYSFGKVLLLGKRKMRNTKNETALFDCLKNYEGSLRKVGIGNKYAVHR